MQLIKQFKFKAKSPESTWVDNAECKRKKFYCSTQNGSVFMGQ